MNTTDSDSTSAANTKSGFDFKRLLEIKFEDSPAFGQGKLPADSDRTFCMLAHPFSFIVWFWKKSESPAVDAHGKETTNFFLSYLCIFIPFQIVVSALASAVPALSILLIIISFAYIALWILGLLKAKDGKLMRYPMNFRFIK